MLVYMDTFFISIYFIYMTHAGRILTAAAVLKYERSWQLESELIRANQSISRILT
jgi:hypothetical protein